MADPNDPGQEAPLQGRVEMTITAPAAEIEQSFSPEPAGCAVQPCPKNQPVGEPGFWEGMIPIWGSGRAAVNDFQTGRWGWGIFNTVMAISDVFLVKALVVGVGKAVAKGVAKEALEQGGKQVAKEGAEQVEKQVAKDGAEHAGQKLLPAPKPSARLTQDGLEHIVERHWPTSGARGAGKFSEGTTARGLRDMINESVEKGVSRPNTRNRPGTIFEHDFGRPIGVDSAGRPATRLRTVVAPDGTVKTAFPF